MTPRRRLAGNLVACSPCFDASPRYCYDHRWRVLIAWVVAARRRQRARADRRRHAAQDVLAAGQRVAARVRRAGSRLRSARATPATSCSRCAAPASVTDAARRRPRSSRCSRRSRTQPHVVSVSSPYDPANARFVSNDGKIAYAEIQFDVQANDVPVDLATHMRGIVEQGEHARPRRSSSAARCSPTRRSPRARRSASSPRSSSCCSRSVRCSRWACRS